ncbi:MAG: elongation factor Ts [Rickettsiales bacterium]|nr:MAG: elongation factor Ts [Rickettsiales bacterium]
MSVSASLVKELREKTGAGMMDCKKALLETNGNFEEAVDWLRTKGLAAAAKKSSRVASEGLTAVSVNGNRAAIIEINSETDFVSRNELFQNLVREVAEIAVNVDDIQSLKSSKAKSGKTIEDEIIANVATIGENLTLRRMQSLSVNDGVIASYVHNAPAENMGTISVIVALESTGDKAVLLDAGRKLAMHIAAAKPQSLNKENVDPELIEREKNIFTEQSRASGKPDNIIEKMIEGRIRKFLEEIVLLDQIYVIDGKSKISEVIADLSKQVNATVVLKSYVKYETGEGIEKEETNFADEVAAVVKG